MDFKETVKIYMGECEGRKRIMKCCEKIIISKIK